MELLNQIILELSFWAVIGGILLLIVNLVRSLNFKELLLLVGAVLAAIGMRLKYGLFAPFHPQDHYVGIFLNLKNNLASGNFFSVPNIYHASGGLYELFYHKILFFLSGFDVYYVYYISIALHVIAGILVFILAWNIFKNKTIAFLSFFIFAFLPVLIKFSATEIIFIINVITILLFINLIFYIINKKQDSLWLYILLFFVYCANLVGRKEFLVYFIVGFVITVIFFLVFHKRSRELIFNNTYVIFFLYFCGLVSLFYSIEYIIPSLIEYVPQSTIGYSENFSRNLFNSFKLHNNNIYSFTPWLKSFFTPWYFSIFFLLSLLLLAFKRYWWLLFIVFLYLLLWSPKIDALFTDLRRMLPFVFLIIPQIAFVFYYFFKKISFTYRKILFVGLIIIVASIFQNQRFLNMDTARRIEQDFLINHIEDTIPPNSLILTVHQKKYENSRFDKKREYKEQEHGLEFPSYLLPQDKNIVLMDIYQEYDPDIIEAYDEVFYYKSLYSHHEEMQRMFYQGTIKNPTNKYAPEATAEFENKHSLNPIEERIVKNTGLEVAKVNYLLKGINRNIHAEGNMKIGLYKVKDF